MGDEVPTLQYINSTRVRVDALVLLAGTACSWLPFVPLSFLLLAQVSWDFELLLWSLQNTTS